MEPLSWTGAVGAFLNPLLGVVVAVLAVAIVAQIILSFFAEEMTLQSNPDGTLMRRGGWLGGIEKVVKTFFLALVGVGLLYILAGVILPYGDAGIVGAIAITMVEP